MDLSQRILSDITVHMKYAKYLKDKKRRETFEEIVNRNKAMHIAKFPHIEQEINEAYEEVLDKNVLPSMRSFQFAGRAIQVNPARMFNCSFMNIDAPEAFSETMFLLLSGCGVGFSVQDRHVSQLPTIKSLKKSAKRYLIGDSIEGWADAVKVLMKTYFNGGSKVVFDYRDIREKGADLVTSGGKAPGPEPLKECLNSVENILATSEVGKKLSGIKVHDIICLIADCVLAGGIRRAALISLFDRFDQEMLRCKSKVSIDDIILEEIHDEYRYQCVVIDTIYGHRYEITLTKQEYEQACEEHKVQWYRLYPHRARANNSVILKRNEITEQEFKNIWQIIENSGSGEPGYYWTNDYDLGTNPCCFTGDTHVAVADGRNSVSIKELAEFSEGKKEFLVYSAKRSTYSNQFASTDKFRNWKPEIKKAVAYKSGTKEVIELLLSDGSSFRCTPDHKIATHDGEWIEAKDAEGVQLAKFFTFSNKNTSKSYRHINSVSNGYAKQYRLIWEFYNGDKPTGFDIDHIDSISTNDDISNLQILETSRHNKKSGKAKIGKNNPANRVSDLVHRKWALSRASIERNGKRYSWSEERIAEALYKFDSENPKPIKDDKNLYLNDAVFVESVSFTGEVEDVYDLTVQDNHNFYIITKSYDENALNCSGVLVHNCEISLNSNQFCNLTTINGSLISNQQELNKRVKAAALIGTLQASYTDFHYLRSDWKKTTEREALLGVSITGIGSGRLEKLNLKEAARVATEENKRVSKLLGIRAAARVTCVKPEGTASLVLGTSSGIHAWHSEYYIRNVRIGKNEALYTYLVTNYPEFIQDEVFRPDRQAVIGIPQKAPEGAILRDENVFDMLERVRRFNIDWVEAGHISGINTHNVSATVSIKANEWDDVGQWLWDNQGDYNGLSVLPFDGHVYQQAPFEDCDKDKYEELFAKLESIDLTKVIEIEDNTNLNDQAACAGNNCEI